MSRAVDEFHAHLDACRQCRDNPMALCRLGAELLEKAALAAVREPAKGTK